MILLCMVTGKYGLFTKTKQNEWLIGKPTPQSSTVWGAGRYVHGVILSFLIINTTAGVTPSDVDSPWFDLRLADRWAIDKGHAVQAKALAEQQLTIDLRPDPELRKWHVDMAIQTGFPKLSSTEQILDRRLDIPLKSDILNVFERPRTPIDRKSSFKLNAIYFALGKRVSDRVIVNWYLGFAPGVDRDHQRYLTADLRINFKYGSYFTGLQAEYYPWGFPRYHNETEWKKRLDASRFYFYSAIGIGYVSAEGAGRYKLLGIRIYEDRIKVRDWLFAGALGAGWSIPISDRWSIQLSGDYSFHVYKPEEYNGWRITTGLRFRF